VIKPLDGMSFKAEDGELVVLLGPSGCGKTTLLSCLAGLLTPTCGRVEFGPVVVNELRGPALAEYRRRTVGVVFQAFNLIASLSARGNVLVPMRLAGRSGWASVRTTARPSCRGDSSSGWLSRGHWCTTRL
jgi:putative ABC transport system ATP-binding protein